MTPLILITGFLGAGKTTLMRRLVPLLTVKNIKPSIILNDYQNAYVDAETFRGLTDQVVPIGGTCVCCGSRYQLMEALAGATLDESSVMLLEANGTADAPELIEILSADPQVARYTLPVHVVVVDAKRWQKRYFHNELERSQVPTAGYIVLTREEETAASHIKKVRAELKTVAPRAVDVTPEMLADAIGELALAVHQLAPRRFDQAASAHDEHHHHHHHGHARHHFSSCELRMPPRVDLDEFREFLQGLPPEVIRAKGIAYENNAANTPWYFQKVEGRDDISFHRIDAKIVYDPVMILIGVNIDPSAYIIPLQALHILDTEPR
ncbi:MAG TPA: GTP-binding protein [Kiritimatiellia bacterium]|nr:GTP-binding protein [Kiritimatiellia bacterium]HMO98369.1 GTP-binding protein [Kiritimatiellia bacterium]